MFDQYILQRLNEWVEKFALNNAFCINEKFYSYKDYVVCISKIRKALQNRNSISKNIGLVVNDDLETYASIFAIWMEGYAYVPLHPQQPVDRSIEIITQADIKLIVDSSIKTDFSNYTVIQSPLLKDVEIDLSLKAIPDSDLAYILFTSGSTGKPKGVQITRENVGAFMKSFLEVGFSIDENDRCLQCFDLTFDVSVQSYLVPLTHGACIYTIPHDQIKYSYVYGLFEDHKITFGAMAPSMIRYLRPYFDEINNQSMRVNILTAEASPLDLITEWSKCIPNAVIYDFYGPTEATIYCTYNHFNRSGVNKQLNGMLSIGKPMNGISAIIIDDEGGLLGKNQKGELCISGDQITPGYWKNEEKNQVSFLERVEGVSTKRYYKTGDSCFFDNDGDIMLAGRIDHQVKIQGYRIELGEIEFHARELLKGQDAVACSFENQMGNTEIALFVEGKLNDEDYLIKHLSGKMPYYMVPTKIVVVDSFPINTSGKVDRINLKKNLLSQL